MIQIDMPMPKNCYECYLSIWAEGECWCPWHNCTVDGHDGDIKRMNNCPLAESEDKEWTKQ